MWVRDYKNGLHVKKTFSSFVFDLQYQPSDYVTVLKNDASPVSKGGHDTNIEYYTLKVSLTDPRRDIINFESQSGAEAQRRKYYFSYLFQEDVYVEENGKRFPCVLFHFERPEFQKTGTFVLGFERPEGSLPGTETRFVIESPYFSSLPIKIAISKTDIPSLKI